MKKFILIPFFFATLILFSCKSDTKNKESSEDILFGKEENFELKIDSLTIFGTITLPIKESKKTIVLLIPGSGPTDRDGNNTIGLRTNSYKMLSDTLSKYGYSSLRYDKRGIGKSVIKNFNEGDFIFDDFVNDVIKIIENLQTDERFSKIVVLGHSEGSLVGILAAQKTDIEAFISIAGAAEAAYELILTQIANQSADLADEVSKYLNDLKVGKNVFVSNMDLWNLFRPSIQPYLISWFKYIPKEEISKLDIPIFIINGTTDIQVDYNEAQKLFQSSKNAELKIIEGMNHILKNADSDTTKNIKTYSNPNLPLNEEFCTEIINFLNRI